MLIIPQKPNRVFLILRQTTLIIRERKKHLRFSQLKPTERQTDTQINPTLTLPIICYTSNCGKHMLFSGTANVDWGVEKSFDLTDACSAGTSDITSSLALTGDVIKRVESVSSIMSRMPPRLDMNFCVCTACIQHSTWSVSDWLGPFYGAIAVPSVTRCWCCRRCGHRFYIAIHQVSLLSHAACAIAIAGFGSYW